MHRNQQNDTSSKAPTLPEGAGEGSPSGEPAPPARCRLTVVIVGAGIGGLATAIALARRGHTVKVFEQAAELAEVGAGVQVPPNSTRLLRRWGLGPRLHALATEPAAITFRRWEDGIVIGYTRLQPDYRETFDAPYYVVHRAHYQKCLFERAREVGVEVRFGTRVERFVEAGKGAGVVLEGVGEVWGDLVVGADGLHSKCRKAILGPKDRQPQLMGFAAYRATVDTQKMRADPDTAWLLDTPGQNCWVGHMRHCMTYTIASGATFNMVLSHPSTTAPSTWVQSTALADARAQFAGWDPVLVKIIGMINSTMKWPLMSGSPLETWVSEGGRMCVLGDAAHAMLPYMSQGAAQAVEDGASLATLLSLVGDVEEIPRALEVWEGLRRPRATQMQEASVVNGKLWHFGDGEEQRMRDGLMRAEVEGGRYLESPNQFSDPVTQVWCYGYDAEEEAGRAWRELK
ncbi:FAD/NAD(P)-binding domain-containing protein [Saccharata proteae CBS 121410]|uniref:FAD/NAD(P)-binding domain-containing protein n=1 Tax=Saccharata proteae CBS 121410 TaxID=1314787 RepID=A0A9P4LWX8_9PEZI|nr:FAD/NAD(P)-binding domain-containing protein [Saccharata proteae CBS 121410]